MKKLLLAFAIIFGFTASASHVTGGEISWEALPNGQYIFTLTLIRDCTGATLNTQTELLTTNSGTSIICNKISTFYINSECGAVPCASVPSGIYGIYENHVYQSGPVTLNGTPPPAGWDFEWTLCCRPNATNIVGAPSVSIHAKMYPYTANGSNVLASQVNDNSPVFLPHQQSRFETQDTNVYQAEAYDVDGDSISYELVNAYSTAISSVSYATGFSGTSPLPNSGVNFMQFNANEGTIQFYSQLTGTYLINMRAKSFRNGQLIAQTDRDYTIAIIPKSPPAGMCSSSPQLPTDITITGVNPNDVLVEDVSVKVNGSFASFTRAMPANLGDTVQFVLNTTNATLGYNCIPVNISFASHTSRLSALDTIISQNMNGSFLSTLSNNVLVKLPITCEALEANQEIFYFDFNTNNCPINKKLRVKVTIPMNTKMVQTLSFDQNASGLQTNGDVNLAWEKPDTLNGFTHYKLWYQNNTNGLQLLDSIANYADTFYVHQSLGAGTNQYWVQSFGVCPATTDSLEILNDTANVFTLKNGIGIPEEVLNVRAYPQPINQVVTFDGFSTGEKVEVRVFDVSGRLLQQENQSPLAGKIEVNTAQLKGGIYVFVLSWADYSTQIKLIKHE